MQASRKKKLKVPWSLAKVAIEMDIEYILQVAKNKIIYETPVHVCASVQAFYNEDTVSCVVPYKKATIIVKYAEGKKKRKCIHVLLKCPFQKHMQCTRKGIKTIN